MKVAKRKKATKQANYSGSFSPVKNGEVTLFKKDKVIEALNGIEPIEAVRNLEKACGMYGDTCKPAEQLRLFKKYTPTLLGLYYMQVECTNAAVKENRRVTNNTLERSRKRWDKDEDETLIELAADDRFSIGNIAIYMGRTPGAIASRITYLVGIQRMSQEIAGRFVGQINGELVNGYIDGVLQKD